MEKRKEKTKESIQAVLPILFIVLLLSFTVAPVSASILLEFMIGAVFVIIGMLFFSMGAEMSMSPMGERVGGSMLKTKKLWVILLLGFFLGVIITISEPDLQVLAAQVPSVPNMVLILSVAAGVGAFLVVALLRILFGIALAPLLVVFYGVIFVIARFVPDNFLAVAFDSGGVTTGPMTVPFIMALGVGISAIRNDKHAENDSFGLVALCSIGLFLRYCSWDWYILPREVMWQRTCRKLSILWNLAGCFYPKFPIISKKLQVPCFQSFSFLEFSSLFPFNYIKRH